MLYNEWLKHQLRKQRRAQGPGAGYKDSEQGICLFCVTLCFPPFICQDKELAEWPSTESGGEWS